MADLLMTMHFLWVLFMVLGLPVGLLTRWPTLRWLHLAGMMITASLALTGAQCPLTVWEELLRRHVDHSFTFDGGFLAHYLSFILFPRVDPWILRGASVLWGVLTVAAMIVIKPVKRGKE